MNDEAMKNFFMGLNDTLAQESGFVLHVMNKKAIAEGEESAKREVDKTMKRVAQGKGPKSCGVCHTTEGLMRCQKCFYGYYCSKGHQQTHWRMHKKMCKSYSAMMLDCSICKISKHVWTGFHGRTENDYCCKQCMKSGKNADYKLKVYTCWNEYLPQLNELVSNCLFILMDSESNPKDGSG